MDESIRLMLNSYRNRGDFYLDRLLEAKTLLARCEAHLELDSEDDRLHPHTRSIKRALLTEVEEFTNHSHIYGGK